jgi:ATP-dependent DNA helicase PIF1
MAASKSPAERDVPEVVAPASSVALPASLRDVWPVGVTPTADYVSAVQHMRDGVGHLFVTGRAGTGKSTLLRTLRDIVTDEIVIVAPTGLAAVNVGGQTIHIRRSRNGRIMRKIKHLVIDEVSMVRSDLMWAIDQSLRVNRGKPREPFGGVRLVLFGDLHQLPPVVQEHEVADHLEENFGGPFFFSVPALMEGDGTTLLELNQVFRQSEGPLLDVLNKVREGRVDEDDLTVLNERVRPIRTLAEGEVFVILTPTNAAAQRINLAYLNALKGAAYTYTAGTTGEFNPSAQPTDQTLTLKVGAKVIMLRNDSERRWVNGSIARISRLEEKQVFITLDGKEYEVEPASWENRRYAYDQAEQKIVETVAGTFTQYPVRLAWAMTIHKSQGMTLENVYLDLGRGTFAHGQAYVALSRCRTLEGLTLARPLQPRDVIFDRSAMKYRDVFHRLAG